MAVNEILLSKVVPTDKKAQEIVEKVVCFFGMSGPGFIATHHANPDAKYFKVGEEDEDEGGMVEDDEDS